MASRFCKHLKSNLISWKRYKTHCGFISLFFFLGGEGELPLFGNFTDTTKGLPAIKLIIHSRGELMNCPDYIQTFDGFPRIHKNTDIISNTSRVEFTRCIYSIVSVLAGHLINHQMLLISIRKRTNSSPTNSFIWAMFYWKHYPFL